MKKKLLLLMLFVLGICYSQNNKKIDSLDIEIQNLNKKIDEIKTEISEEILTNGYEIKVKKKYSFSKLYVYNKKYGKVIDTLKENEIIKIIDKEIIVYKIRYNNGKTGFIETSDFDIGNNSPLENLDNKSYREILSKTKKNRNSRSGSGNTWVKGHYRKTKSGKRVYVKPHRRKK